MSAARGGRRWWDPKVATGPSKVSPFIMWQQPHPIYMAELLYRAKPSRETLTKYRELVAETANLLASFPHLDQKRGQYVIGPPIIPAQEVLPPLTTFNPTFELEYFRFGLATAQKWREAAAAAQPRNSRVGSRAREIVAAASEGRPVSRYRIVSDVVGSGTQPGVLQRQDQARVFQSRSPSFLGALGLLPGESVDNQAMKRTLAAVQAHWDLRQTWGWDYPLIAMTGRPRRRADDLRWTSCCSMAGTTSSARAA